ncbi:gastrula zinc finger protein XlCGF28.1-like [Anopheles aquasalis]|uniref:gastrula zinc finger protein XlCGF28.1-like n=1 Tax=Anopheles aquasalis TaxID=42839 RepID=UPI00215A370E|nr:gastrula zinc finger protein XlCGF28.1-like [Anopheles aquasalis]
MNVLCGTCGEQNDDPGEMQHIANFSEMYFVLTSINVHESESLAGCMVCAGCQEKLQELEQFRAMCIRVHESLIQVAADKERIGLNDVIHDDPGEKSFLHPESVSPSPDGHHTIEENRPITQSSDSDEGEAVCDDIVDESNSSEVPAGQICETLFEAATVPGTGRGIFLFGCTKCEKKFKTQTRLDGHLREHQGLKPAVCDICGKEFIKWFNLKMHIRHKHTDEQQPKVQCDFPGCQLTYTTVANMRKHRKSHDPNYMAPQPQQYICEQCGKSYTTAGALKAHTYSHTGDRPFACTLCEKKFVNSNKLRIHMMRHQGIKKYECPHCGMKKTTKNELRIHINHHTKERLSICSTCGQSFTSSGNLARHVRIVHRGIKAFKCQHCGQSFAKAETLKHHVMTHTGERPHACAECGKRFIQLVALRTHIKTHAKALGTATILRHDSTVKRNDQLYCGEDKSNPIV